MRDVRKSKKVRSLLKGKHGRAFSKMLRGMYGKFLKMFHPGRSKHADKLANHGKPLINVIYSYRTLDLYLSVCCTFLIWVFLTYNCSRIGDAQIYVAEYLNMRIAKGLSPWTIHVDASAIAKLYQCSYTDFGVSLPVRQRSKSTKNTIDKEALVNFEKTHPILSRFCRSCGVRRSELLLLRPEDIYIDNLGRTIVHVRRGKGGKVRNIIALDDFPLHARDLAIANGQDMLFRSIPPHAPIHVFRKLFAQAMYQKYARPIETLSKKQRYCCRAEMKGIVFDRAVMYDVSLQLGHSRLGVVTTYLKEAIISSAKDNSYCANARIKVVH